MSVSRLIVQRGADISQEHLHGVRFLFVHVPWWHNPSCGDILPQALCEGRTIIQVQDSAELARALQTLVHHGRITANSECMLLTVQLEGTRRTRATAEELNILVYARTARCAGSS